MDLVDCLVELVEVLVFLLSKAIEPYVLILLVVRDYVRIPVTKVLLPQLHRPLQFDLLHASIFLLSLDVGGRDVQSAVRVKLALGSVHNMLCSPFFVNVNNCFGLLAKERCCPFEMVGTDRKLSRGAEASFDLFEPSSVDDVLLILPKVSVFFSILVKYRSVI